MKIRTFEAARGLLALWVVIGHTIKHAGYNPEDIGPWSLLAKPELAVDCFIMLSGFVIFLLLDAQRISYRDYITRRFLRIAPIYAAVLAVSALTLGWQLDVISAQRWSNATILGDLKLHRDGLDHLAAHLLAHATMLHGLVPPSVLPSGLYAIVGQAWSISVEWQFYLIAPVAFYLLTAQRWRMLGVLLLLLALLCNQPMFGDGSVVRQGGFFVVGILSFYLWKHSEAVRSEHLPLLELFAATGIAFALYFMSTHKISMILWVVMLAMAIAEKCRVNGNLFSLLTPVASKPPLQWLGKISYSLYLVHNLVIYFWIDQLDTRFPSIPKAAVLGALLPLVIVTGVAVSALTYRWIESPFMRLGGRVGRQSKPAQDLEASYQHPA
jgi:peptidoglycan/LPS O-acetylase OafA/YrhL